MEENAIVVRRIRPQDEPRFTPLLFAFFAHAKNPLPAPADYQPFFAKLSAPNTQLCFLGAFEGGALLGIASLARVESSYRLMPFAYCDDVFVQEGARGRGVGQLLLEGVLREARTWGASSVLLGADAGGPAARLYKRAGFRPMGALLYCPLED